MKRKSLKLKIKVLCGIFALLFIMNKSFAQKPMTKEEILLSLNHDKKYYQTDTAHLLQYDQNLKKRVDVFLDSLRISGIDTIGFFCESNPGFISGDSCQKGPYPSNIIIFWKEKGGVSTQKINNFCRGSSVKLKSSVFFSFYSSQKEKINNERLFPVIYSATKSTSGEVKYNISYSASSSIYTLFIQESKNSKALFFSENILTDTKNIFYSNNVSSFSYRWFENVKAELSDLNL